MSSKKDTHDATAGGEPPAGRRVVRTLEFIGTDALTGSEGLPELLDRARADDLSLRVIGCAVEDLDSSRPMLLAIAHDQDPELFRLDPAAILLEDMPGGAADPGVIDYRVAEPLIRLLEDRDCEVLDRQQIGKAVSRDPGPVYHEGWDRDETGHTWEQRGGPWADRLMATLAAEGAITLPGTEAVS